MSTNSYAVVDDLIALYQRQIQTSGVTRDALEIYGNLADGWANGKLATRYTVPFSAGWYPIEPLRTAVLIKWGANFFRSQAFAEDPSWWDRVQAMDEQADAALEPAISGKAHLFAMLSSPASAFVIGPREDYRQRIRSKVAETYVPTAGLVPSEEERIDATRVEDERVKRGSVVP